MIKKILRWWRSLRYHRYYIIADSADNSITFSRKLYKHIELHSDCNAAARVFMFHVPAWDTYGFVINPELDQETNLADIQYNEKYKTIGFESLCPSVGRILYDYGLPSDFKIRLTVTVRQLVAGKVVYNIERPCL